MPTVTEQRRQGYAHCEDSLCTGNAQRPVEVVCTTVRHMYVDSGGDLPGEEKSFEYIAFADPDDSVCPDCGGPRACATQTRPVYPTSQYAQDGLLKLIRDGMVKPMGEATQRHGTEIGELKALAVAQQAQIEELKALVSEKRGPGRPRKTVDEPADSEA